MRRVAVSLSVFLLSVALAEAQPSAIHPQPKASDASAPTETGVPDDPVRAAAKAHQENFDRRIADRSDKAVRSICSGCDGAAAKPRSGAPRRLAKATAAPPAEPVIDEPEDGDTE